MADSLSLSAVDASAFASSSSDTIPRLPAEILADIIELAVLTSSPCPIAPPSTSSSSSDEAPKYPFSTPLRSTYTSAWAWTGSLLYVSKFFHSVVQPLLFRTLTLDTDAGARSFFDSLSSERLSRVERAWFGNVSALAREEVNVEPIGMRLHEAGWYEECSGGFVVGHAYASREKPRKKQRRDRDNGAYGSARPKQYRSVSVYWAEEQLVEEVSDPERSSEDGDSASGTNDSDDEAASSSPLSGIGNAQVEPARSLPSPAWLNSARIAQRRRSHHDSTSTRDPRIDRPHEPAWQTLYSRQRRTSPARVRRQSSATLASASMPRRASEMSSSSQAGPAEGDLDPWDMQDAQERLAALANSAADGMDRETSQQLSSDISGVARDEDGQASSLVPEPSAISTSSRRRRREIYAYHLCTATLEPWINPLLASIRSLRLITITFYPGHLLDDDKLEHMLRRILSPSECPRLQTLLIRIIFDAASAGSRMRRFERTKTIAGAVDRIGDERVRVMLVNNRVGEGELVASPSGRVGAEDVNALSRKAITLTKEAWWSRVLQQNHHSGLIEGNHAEGENSEADAEKERRERRLSDWQMFFPPHQHLNPTHLINLIHHCDAWPDHPTPLP